MFIQNFPRHFHFLRTLSTTIPVRRLHLKSRNIDSKFRFLKINRFIHPSATVIRQLSSISHGQDEDLDIVLPPMYSSWKGKGKFRVDDQSESSIEEQNRDPQTLLNLIKEKTRASGRELVLSDSYLANLDQSPLALLLKEGPNLKMNYIADAFALRPKFLEISTSKWEAVLKTFQEAEVSTGIALAAVVGHPKIFEMEIRELNFVLVQLSNLGVRDRILSSVVAKRPQVLTTDINRINELIENVTSFFPRDKFPILIRRDPEVLFMDFEKLEAKYEYVFYNMGLDAMDLYRSRKWHRLSLATIECRHQFMVRCGAYVMPNEKKPEKALDNPRLDLILDTEDQDFCKLAGVSMLEWEMFKNIYADEEPFEAAPLSEEFFKSTRRTAPREPEEEWEYVPHEEMVEDQERMPEREEKQASGKGGMKKGMRDRGDRGGRSIEDGRRDRRSDRLDSKDMDDENQKRRISSRRDSNDVDHDRQKKAQPKVYARSLTEKEMTELSAHLNKMRVGTGAGFHNVRDEEESDDDDDEGYQEYERRKMEKEKEMNKQKFMAKGRTRIQFRKRGTYLASDD